MNSRCFPFRMALPPLWGQLRNRSNWGAKRRREREGAFYSRHRILHHLVVVECQGREASEWPPLCFGCIVPSFHFSRSVNQCEVCYADGASSRVAVHLGICTNLSDRLYLEARLLPQFPYGTFLCRLVHLHEAAGECPAALVRLDATLHEQHTRMCFPRYDHTVGSHRRPWIFVMISQFFHSTMHVFTIIFLMFRIHKYPNPSVSEPRFRIQRASFSHTKLLLFHYIANDKAGK